MFVKNIRKKAFSLVEISVVIVIITLLMATIMASRVLIEATQLNKIQSDTANIQILTDVFRNTFDCLAGDCPYRQLPENIRSQTPSGCFNLKNDYITPLTSPIITTGFNTGAIDQNAKRSCMFYEFIAFESQASYLPKNTIAKKINSVLGVQSANAVAKILLSGNQVLQDIIATRTDSINTSIATNNIALVAKQNTFTTNQTIIETNNTTILANQAIIATNNPTIASNQTTITANNATIAANQATIETNQATIAANNTTIATNQATIAANNTTIATNQATIAANNTTIAANNTTIAANNTTIATNQATIATNQATIATKNTTIAANNTTIANHQNNMTNQRTYATNMANYNGGSCPTVTDSHMTNLAVNNSCAWQRMNVLQCGSTSCGSYCTSLCYANDFNNNVLSSYNNSKANITTLTVNNTTLNSQITTATDTVNTLTAQNTTLNSQVTTATNTVNTLTAQNATLNSQITTATNTVDTLTAQNATLNTQIADATLLKATLDTQLEISSEPNTYLAMSVNSATNPIVSSTLSSSMWDSITVSQTNKTYPYEASNLSGILGKQLLISRNTSTNNINSTNIDGVAIAPENDKMAGFSASFSRKMDTKFDDGKPYTGNIIAGKNVADLANIKGCTNISLANFTDVANHLDADYAKGNSLVGGCVVGFIIKS